MAQRKDLTPFMDTIGVHFKNPDLMTMAFVHRSYLNEHPGFGLDHNERLEFLGDAVLELIVTEHLYNSYDDPEGELTNWRASLVNADMLAQIAADMGVEQWLYLSRGEEKDAGTKARHYILANAMEAIIGAIYLDQGWDVSKNFVHRFVIEKLPEIIATQSYIDAKSRFQEAAQEKMGVTPSYRVLEESGPDHAKNFKVGIFLEKELVAAGEGTSKQEAQMAAAREGLKVKGW
ncbi:MAG: putative ribonuclease III [Candidatus Magasanikbacteria bacterium]|nr:putative ribonuclease III [Candidatus Magasanikbacteria bacterium]